LRRRRRRRRRRENGNLEEKFAIKTYFPDCTITEHYLEDRSPRSYSG